MSEEFSTQRTSRTLLCPRAVVVGLIVLALRLSTQIPSFVPLSFVQGQTNYRVCATVDANNSGVADLVGTLVNPVTGARSIGIF